MDMRDATTPADESLRYLRALGDPDRLHIVQALRSAPKTVGEICRALRSPMANVSHHLRMLKDAGIVSARKRGRFVIYSLNQAVTASAPGGQTQVLDFGCCRVEFAERKRAGRGGVGTPAATVNDQALLILNRILGQMPPGQVAARVRKKSPRTSAVGSRQVKLVNPSFERPATAFFDTAVEGWIKEGDPAGTGVFRNFPDDTPLPGSRMVRNADGNQLAGIAARNPGGRGDKPVALFQELSEVPYRAGASYVLSLGVGVSSVQPPAGGGRRKPPRLRLALTFTDDAGRRQEVVGRSVTPADVIAGQPEAAGNPPTWLVHFSVAMTVPAAHPCIGRAIGVLVTTAENTAAHSGHFIMDDVSLAADSPAGRAGALPQRSNVR